MANQLGALTVAPRSNSKHLRHARFARLPLTRTKHGAEQFTTFLTTQATRLSTTSSAIFTFLKKNTADRIRRAVSTASLS